MTILIKIPCQTWVSEKFFTLGKKTRKRNIILENLITAKGSSLQKKAQGTSAPFTYTIKFPDSSQDSLWAPQITSVQNMINTCQVEWEAGRQLGEFSPADCKPFLPLVCTLLLLKVCEHWRYVKQHI